MVERDFVSVGISKSKAALIHLSGSLIIAVLAAIAVFLIWFPTPYWELSGGGALFLVLISVDVVIGPLLTWIVFNPSKKKKEVAVDIGVICLMQISALAYGLHATYMARPIYLVHEVDRFIVVSAADVADAGLLSKAPKELQHPLPGVVKLIGVREINDPTERLQSIEQAILGRDVSLRPQYWQELSLENKKTIASRSKPIAKLVQRTPSARADVMAIVEDAKKSETDLAYLPVVGHNVIWSAIIDKAESKIVGFVKVDGF